LQGNEAARARSGGIRCSSTLPHITTYIEQNVFDVYQIPYSGLERAHEERDFAGRHGRARELSIAAACEGEPGVGLGSGDRWAKFEAANLD